MTVPGGRVKAACGVAGPGSIYCAMIDKTQDPKKERLAAALRANLRRRKAQERAQGESPASPPASKE